MKLVIGIAGLPLAGKETVANRLEQLFRVDNITVSRHRFSDVLRDTLDLWGMPHGRGNEQTLAQIMQRPGAFPEGVLSRAVKYRLSRDAADVGILDGVRWKVDEDMIREFPADGIQSIVVSVAANDGTRFERLTARNRSGESATSRAEFDELNKQPNEIFIPDIAARADIQLSNDYANIADFEKEIDAAYAAKIKPLLQ